MKSLLLAFVATALAAPRWHFASLYDEPVSDTGVVGGEPVGTSEKFPWMVSLQRGAVGPYNAFCGGSLIAPNIILTAAHCTTGYGGPKRHSATSRRYEINKSSESEGGIDFEVLEWLVHPNYTSINNAPVNDIALWVVKVAKNWGNKPVAFAPYATEAAHPESYTNVTVIGWGAVSEGGSQSKLLLQTVVPTISTADCKKQYGTQERAISDNNICAGFPDGGKDTCQGDSGGPLFEYKTVGNAADGPIVAPVIAGITSWGQGCARKGKAGIYTRVGAYASWVKSVVDKYNPPASPEVPVVPSEPVPEPAQPIVEPAQPISEPADNPFKRFWGSWGEKNVKEEEHNLFY